RLVSDWSSDVCSSDLEIIIPSLKCPSRRSPACPSVSDQTATAPGCSIRPKTLQPTHRRRPGRIGVVAQVHGPQDGGLADQKTVRSEERRVGKEGRCGG